MTRLIVLLTTLLLIACSGPRAPSAVAITGATVIDVRDGAHLADSVIVMDAGKITAVGTAREAQIPAGARVVDARGKYVIPGLWDLHVHVENQRELDVFFPLFIAHGVLSIRETGGLLPSEVKELCNGR